MDIASALSSPLIPTMTAILGVASLLLAGYKIRNNDYRYYTLLVFGVWMMVEVMCYAVTSAVIARDLFADTWLADMSISYGYIYAASSTLLMVYCLKKPHLFHKDVVLIFLSITLISTPFWCYRFYMQTGAETWGAEFYLNNGVLLDGAYFAIITGLEVWMAWLGIKCAIAPADAKSGILA